MPLCSVTALAPCSRGGLYSPQMKLALALSNQWNVAEATVLVLRQLQKPCSPLCLSLPLPAPGGWKRTEEAALSQYFR